VTRDPYVYHDSDSILINKLGIKDAKLLEQAEGALVFRRHQELTPDFPRGKFDYTHLKAIHRHLFQDVYEWAGIARTVNIAKESGPFAITGFIGQEAHKIFARLKSDNHLRSLACNAFCAKAADYYADINALHPFREGNGRTQNAFMSQLAYHAGYELRWSKTTKEDYLGKL